MLAPETLTLIRRQLGLGKEAMARLLGVGVSTIHRWERTGEPTTGPTGPVLQLYRALEAALQHGNPPSAILAGMDGDPGLFYAHVFALAYAEVPDATGRPLRNPQTAGRGRVRTRLSRS